MPEYVEYTCTHFTAFREDDSMFSYSTSEEKVLYQCYSTENFILKIENEDRRKERMFSFYV